MSYYIFLILALLSFNVYASNDIDIEKCKTKYTNDYKYCSNYNLLYKQGKKYLDQKDYKEAFKYLYRASSYGENSNAQYELAYMYLRGLGVRQEFGVTFNYLKKSAKQGNENAICKLAQLSSIQNAEPKSLLKIYGNIQDTNSTSYKCISHYLSMMYMEGIGVKRDTGLAIKMLEDNSNKNYGESLLQLAVMHLRGELVERSYKKVYDLANKAIILEHKDAYAFIGTLYEFGLGVNQSYDLALDNYNKSKNMSSGLAYSNLAALYSNGGFKVDYDRAYQLSIKAYELGDKTAAFNIANMYHHGNGVQKDLEKFIYWIRKSALQRNSTSQFLLSAHYLYNQQADPSGIIKAYAWADIAKRHGSRKADNILVDITKKISKEQKHKANALVLDYLGEITKQEIIRAWK